MINQETDFGPINRARGGVLGFEPAQPTHLGLLPPREQFTVERCPTGGLCIVVAGRPIGAFSSDEECVRRIEAILSNWAMNSSNPYGFKLAGEK